jgi:hypothetical protein
MPSHMTNAHTYCSTGIVHIPSCGSFSTIMASWCRIGRLDRARAHAYIGSWGITLRVRCLETLEHSSLISCLMSHLALSIASSFITSDCKMRSMVWSAVSWWENTYIEVCSVGNSRATSRTSKHYPRHSLAYPSCATLRCTFFNCAFCVRRSSS